MCPSLLVQEIGNEVIDMQPLHDDHDCVVSLIVEPREQRIADAIVLNACAQYPNKHLEASSDHPRMMKLPPRPVNVPPTDVVYR